MPSAPAPDSLPLRFTPPAGWPQPGADWLAAHQGWDMPKGWRPTPEAEPAPVDWTWWTQDPAAWAALVGPRRADLRRSIALAAILLLLGVVLVVLRGHSWVAVPAWGAVVAGPVVLARHLGALCRLDGTVVTDLRKRALEIRRSSPWFDYTSDTGLTAAFHRPARLHTTGRRIVTLGFATVAGAGLALVLAVSVVGHETGSGAALALTAAGDAGSVARTAVSVPGPAPTAAATSAASGATASFLADTEPTNARCATASCWIVRIAPERRCTEALVVVEFADGVGETPRRHVLLRVPVSGGAAVDVAAESASRAEHDADVASAACSTS